MSKSPDKNQDIKEPNSDPTELSRQESRLAMNLWIFMSVLFFCVSVILVYATYRIINNPSESIGDQLKTLSNQIVADKDSREGQVRRKLDGVYVEDGQEDLFPLAVMIDNHQDARPPAGINQAGLVFEAEAEGRMTRFMAVFTGVEDLDRIGPVRSARPYFVDWARELSALYVHVGGSPEALAKMAKESTLHINEFYDGQYFWRDDKRPRPHNVITSRKKLDDYLSGRQEFESSFLSWQFKDEAIPAERGVDKNEITIEYRLAVTELKWLYNREANAYSREVAENMHLDEAGGQILAKNIVIQVVPAVELDAELRLRMDNIGEGEAVVCLDGKCETGTWKKNNASARTRYYNESGKEFTFNAGPIWVQVVRPDIEFDYEGKVLEEEKDDIM